MFATEAERTKESAEESRAHRQAELLRDVSKVLAGFENVERTIPVVLALIGESAPLCIATLILKETAPRRYRLIWITQMGATPTTGGSAHVNEVRAQG